MSRPIFERSIDTDRVVAALVGVNGEIGYTALAAQADVTKDRLMSVLPSARRILLKHRIVFGTIRAVGLKRLNEPEKVNKSDDLKKRIGRAASRGRQETERIDGAQLSNADQLRLTANRTIFALISSQTAASKLGKPPAAPAIPAAPLPDLGRLRQMK